MSNKSTKIREKTYAKLPEKSLKTFSQNEADVRLRASCLSYERKEESHKD